MCLILFGSASDLILKSEWLANAYAHNEDSIGISDGVNVVYPTSLKGLMKEINFLSVQKLDAMVHFRFATKGAITKENTHPFILENGYVFAHNGHISLDDLVNACNYLDISKDVYVYSKWYNTEFSDTRILVHILNEANFEQQHRILSVITGSRFILWKQGEDPIFFNGFTFADNVALSNLYSIEAPLYMNTEEDCPACTEVIESDWFYCAYCGLDLEDPFQEGVADYTEGVIVNV